MQKGTVSVRGNRPMGWTLRFLAAELDFGLSAITVHVFHDFQALTLTYLNGIRPASSRV